MLSCDAHFDLQAGGELESAEHAGHLDGPFG
jgi:hypothetical protein